MRTHTTATENAAAENAAATTTASTNPNRFVVAITVALLAVTLIATLVILGLAGVVAVQNTDNPTGLLLVIGGLALAITISLVACLRSVIR